MAYSSLLSLHQSPRASIFSHSHPVPRVLHQGMLALAIPRRTQRYQTGLRLSSCPLLLAYVCWVIDAIRDEKQAHQTQCYLEEGILEWAQHQQLKFLPEGRRGLETWIHKLPTSRRPPNSLTGLLG